MTLKQVIEKSIEGGWNQPKIGYRWEVPLLDPLFWQALGKSMGWKMEERFTCTICGERCLENAEEHQHAWSRIIPTYQYELHRLIDHLAEGKTIESFFEKL